MRRSVWISSSKTDFALRISEEGLISSDMKMLSVFLATALAALPSALFATDGTESSFVDKWREAPDTVFQAEDVDLDALLWVARPVVVFAESDADPAFQRQMDLLSARFDELVERDVIVIVDTSPDPRSDVRRKLRPRGFMLTLIGKDGGVKLRKPFPWDVRELSRSIDKMPIRKQELRDRRASN